MALGTVTTIRRTVFGDMRAVIVDVNGSSGANYTTGGEVFAAAQVGATGTLFSVAQVGSGTALRRAVWDKTNKKLIFLAAATDVEIAGNTDLSAVADQVRLLCLLK